VAAGTPVRTNDTPFSEDGWEDETVDQGSLELAARCADLPDSAPFPRSEIAGHAVVPAIPRGPIDASRPRSREDLQPS
jgi:hypothetical protein